MPDSQRSSLRSLKRDHEVGIAGDVEAILLRDFDVSLGERSDHDARKGRLRVDFTYEDAEPPVALEVTSLTDDVLRRAGDAAHKSKGRLTSVVREESLGNWTSAFKAACSVNALIPEALALIREWVPRSPKSGDHVRPGTYTAEQLLRFSSDRRREEFKRQHERLKRLGLVELHFVGPHPNKVEFMAMGEAFKVVPPMEALAFAASDNAKKLGETRPRETHLAVEVRRPDLGNELQHAPPVDLPPEVDVLWVLFTWNRSREGSRRIWSLRRNQAWVEHRDPR